MRYAVRTVDPARPAQEQLGENLSLHDTVEEAAQHAVELRPGVNCRVVGWHNGRAVSLRGKPEMPIVSRIYSQASRIRMEAEL